MTVPLVAAAQLRAASTASGTTRAWPLIAGLAMLGAALATNAILGPLGADIIRYHYGVSMINQALGLDAVALLVAAPLAAVAAWLLHRRHQAGAVLAFAPALFGAYMLPQYVIGPDYLGLPGNNEDFVLGHVAVFIVAVAVAIAAWRHIDPALLLPRSRASDRRRSWVLLGLAAFIALGRQLPAVLAVAADPTTNAAYQDNPTAFWLVAFLDLGVVVPAAVATAVALRRGSPWARTGSYAVIGWFALVPASVAAMSLAMWLNDDPLVTTSDTVLFALVAGVLTLAAAWLYRPLFTSGAGRPAR